MTLFRFHKGGLEESMKTVVEVKDREELFKIIKQWSRPFRCWPDRRHRIRLAALTIAPYFGMDERIGWDTYIICMNGAPVGFTNGPLG